MRRLAAIAILGLALGVFALCASAQAQFTAPDGTPLSAPAPVLLAGTVWLAQDSEGETVYEFLPTGVLRYSYGGKTFTNGTWRQDGSAVYMETNRRYSENTGVITGDVMSGEGKNVGGLSWKWSAKLQR